ncbi:GGDEF-domain-containing protein [Suillus brevipes Sb2]|nr:GGDEF-domain-containing protein [Suillus brevipes Sb2]
MAISQDITDRKLVEKLSISDGLTDLFNRRHFDTIFPTLINNARRYNQRICFLMFDVDYFKAYNDTYGHQMGDEVLIKIAKTLKKSIKRAGDFPFRLGGEEFGVLYQADSKTEAMYFANKLKANIENLNIPHDGSSKYRVITVSMGLICSEINQDDTVDSLYKKVDELLYQAKAAGRNKLISL